MAGIACPSCSTENPATARFCMACGTALPRTCPNCGEPAPAEARFCMSCGGSLVDGGSPSPALARPPPPPAPRPLLHSEERRPGTVPFADPSRYTARAQRLDPAGVQGLV